MDRLLRELDSKRDPDADGESDLVVSLKEKIAILEEKLQQEAKCVYLVKLALSN